MQPGKEAGRKGLLIGLLAGLCACAGQEGASKTRDVTLRTVDGASRSFALAGNGELIGPELALKPTTDGYRGLANSALVELRSNGERITGTMRNTIVDLHVSNEDEGLFVRGLFAGKLGRIAASATNIYSTLGPCTYDLEAKGARYEGQRYCGRRSMIVPAAIELPPGFQRLPVDRQMMLLAILLTQ
jgi:hypothetical protein